MSQYGSYDLLLTYLPAGNTGLTPAIANQWLTVVSSDFDEELGFSFAGDSVTALLDSTGSDVIVLPPPGAGAVGLVTEDDQILQTVEWRIVPTDARLLTRIDGDGNRIAWVRGRSVVEVKYTAVPVPAALQHACCVEAAKAYSGRRGGQSDSIGVSGSTAAVYKREWSDGTKATIRRLREKYGA